MNTDLLIALYKVYSPSYGEKPMRKFIKKYARSIGANNLFSDNGNLYITKGKAETYPCVVAHMDQVQKKHSKNFECMISGDIIFGYDAKDIKYVRKPEDMLNKIVEDDDFMFDQEGLGADDKNGVWVALECLKKYDNIKVAFFMGEEVGCAGSSKAKMDFFKDCRFVVQCDRRNGGDFIYDVYGKMCSDEFIKDTHYKEFGYKMCEGLSTDVAELYSNEVGISCVNLSCGYYNPHTDYEYTKLSELENCLHLVEYIIENCTKVYTHEYEKYDYRTFGNWDYYYPSHYSGVSSSNYYYYDDSDYDIMEDIITNNPELSFEDICKYYTTMFTCRDIDILRDIYEDLKMYYSETYYSEPFFEEEKKIS